jgi:hypothetical protein
MSMAVMKENLNGKADENSTSGLRRARTVNFLIQKQKKNVFSNSSSLARKREQ